MDTVSLIVCIWGWLSDERDKFIEAAKCLKTFKSSIIVISFLLGGKYNLLKPTYQSECNV
jgi:hypothetical protein